MTAQEQKELDSRINKYVNHIEKSYSVAINKIASLYAILPPSNKVNLNDYPIVKRRINEIVKVLSEDVASRILACLEAESIMAIRSVNTLTEQILKKPISSLTAAEQKYYIGYKTSHASTELVNRLTKGVTLSRRLWRYTSDQFKSEIELALKTGIENGTSASKIATEIKQYLNEPSRLFRSVSGDDGKLLLSEAAKKYNPGSGIYRSSYKNALRLTRTEINIAYRTAECNAMRHQNYVLGYEVKMSNNHPYEDICDELKGVYPKTFMFTGWHPQCRCYILSIVKSEKEIEIDIERIQHGLPPIQSPNEVKQLPVNFIRWLDANTEKIKKMHNKPYFILDNPTIISLK